ncbi:SapC family protein [Pseudomonadota bacterium AL_CKDN230030165-1A_HGKHYDSX7]
MPKFVALSPSQHKDARWLLKTSYKFAGTDALVPVVAREAHKVLLDMPLAFARRPEGGFALMGVQGLVANTNLFVADDGRWTGRYIPAVYRGYPFALGRTDDGREVLCFDVESGQLSDDGGERFFEDNGEPASKVAGMLSFHEAVTLNRRQTNFACDVLEKHGLIQPWEINLELASGTNRIGGLFRIDEAKLKQQSGDVLGALMQSHAMPLAYCQLLSMQQLEQLGIRARARSAAGKAALSTDQYGDINLDFLNDDGVFPFGHS